MRIALIIEGKTERAFIPHLRAFLQTRLPNAMPRLDVSCYDGRIPTENKLKKRVDHLLNDGTRSADAVIALTDVYTGTRDFRDAADAKAKMRTWVGPNTRFHPHAAQYDFEAWLIPYWPEIQRLAGHNKTAPSGNPETVDHGNPPSRRIAEVFRIGKPGRAYLKSRDAGRILRNKDLLVAARACPELQALLNTILTLCGGSPVA